MLQGECYCGNRFNFYPSQHRQFCSMRCYQRWRVENRAFASLVKATEAKTIRPNLQICPALTYVVGALKGDGWTRIEKRSRGTAWKIFLAAGLSQTFANQFAKALTELNLHPSGGLAVRSRGRKATWLVTANSKLFVQWYRGLDSEYLGELFEQLPLAAGFLRGIYEAEGTLWKMRGYARCTIINKSSEIILLCLNALDTLHLNYAIGLYNGKYTLNIQPTIEAARFLALTNTSIKNDLPIPRYKNNSAYGLFDETGRRVAGDTEESIYQALGLPWQPPEER